MMPRLPELGAAFATPSVVHFAVVLLLSALMSAPWHDTSALTVIWAVVGIFGIVYELIIARRMRSQKVYRPVFEDWLFHVLLPITAYAMFGAAAVFAMSRTRTALFVVAFATLLFLFVGIHNAWDAVTWHIFSRKDEQRKPKRKHST